MKLPDLNDVRFLVAAAQAGTLSAAGRELRVPPSTVSRALTRLEKHLGVLLLQRTSKGLTLTDAGKDYLQTCRRALRTLKEGGELLTEQRSQPRGLLKIVCPVTMARDVLAPLQPEFLSRYPGLRVEIESYSSGFDQEPREDVDVFFKLRAPKDSVRRIRPYPSTARGLFASHAYVERSGMPRKPDDLPAHTCVGSGTWKLTRGQQLGAPSIAFRVVTSDPNVNLTLALQGFGICILPLWMAGWPEAREKLVPILPQWKLEPLTLCALFSGQSRLTPKVQVLLDFLAEYIGTRRDPRLRQPWSSTYFIQPSTLATTKQ